MIKVGIFGVGYLGKLHIQNWLKIADCKMIGFFDPNKENAKYAKENFQLKQFLNEDELIDKCDLIDVITPTPFHFYLAEKAIKKGKHVFVEKPITATKEDSKKIIELVKESNIKFQVGHIERFNPAYKSIQHIHPQPRFIEVHRLAQFNPRGTEVSVVLDLMIHDIDIILHLINSPIKKIFANGVSVISDTTDIANVRIEFMNGVVANLTSSRISLKKMRKMRLFQKDAYISIDFLEKKSEIIKIKDELQTEGFHFDIETNQGIKTISLQQPIIENTNALLEELTSFIDAIKNKTPTKINEFDGFAALEVALEIIDKIAETTNI